MSIVAHSNDCSCIECNAVRVMTVSTLHRKVADAEDRHMAEVARLRERVANWEKRELEYVRTGNGRAMLEDAKDKLRAVLSSTTSAAEWLAERDAKAKVEGANEMLDRIRASLTAENGGVDTVIGEAIERVRSEERERCAKATVDAYDTFHSLYRHPVISIQSLGDGVAKILLDLADAIRAEPTTGAKGKTPK